MDAASDADSAGQSTPTQARLLGRASILVPIVLLALAALGVGFWALRPPTAQPPIAPGPRAQPAGDGTAEAQGPVLRYEIGRGEQAPQPSERTPREQRPGADPRSRFEGTGVLEVRLSLPPGVPAPQTWAVVIAPSSVLIGGEHARPRRVELGGGALECALADVPLGGYEVWAEAEGMSGRHEHIVLARPDATLVYQDLRLVPLAFVEGLVRDEEGIGVAGLPLFLLPLGGGARLETRAAGAGLYLFERVPDGAYLLEVGFADASLVPPRELAVLAPSLHVPPLDLPRLHELLALVLDADGFPLPGASVRGWCSAGGRVEATSDAFGIARQSWIPAGRVTLEASLPDRPQAGHVRVHVDFPAPADGPLELRLRR